MCSGEYSDLGDIPWQFPLSTHPCNRPNIYLGVSVYVGIGYECLKIVMSLYGHYNTLGVICKWQIIEFGGDIFVVGAYYLSGWDVGALSMILQLVTGLHIFLWKLFIAPPIKITILLFMTITLLGIEHNIVWNILDVVLVYPGVTSWIH